MHRSIAALVAGLTLTAAPRASYLLFEPRGKVYPKNTLRPREDKGSAYRFVSLSRKKPGNLTRMIVA